MESRQQREIHGSRGLQMQPGVEIARGQAAAHGHKPLGPFRVTVFVMMQIEFWRIYPAHAFHCGPPRTDAYIATR